MKSLLIILALVGWALAGAAEKKSEQEFLDFQPSQQRPFSKADAQAMADAQRVKAYGGCGVSVFKEKKGSLWIFETKAGYGGVSRPDIVVAEPLASFPIAAANMRKKENSAQPARFNGLLLDWVD